MGIKQKLAELGLLAAIFGDGQHASILGKIEQPNYFHLFLEEVVLSIVNLNNYHLQL